MRAIAVALVAAASTLAGCVESRFTLDQTSRLPTWFSLPVGVTRNDVTVKITYYTPTRDGDDALFELVDDRGRTLSSIRGQFCWHPAMASKKNKHGGFDPDAYPLYGYVQTKRGLEVLEHSAPGPVLRISDDPLLQKGALESTNCDIG